MRTLIIILLLIANIVAHVFGQTGQIHVNQDMTGHKILNLGTPTLDGDGANKLYVDTHGGGGGGGGTVTSITATTPIVVTPSPLVATGVISLDSTSKTNWDTAFTQTRQWDGGATGLVAATGRTSLGLVIGTNVAPATSGSSILYGNGSGGFSNVTVGSGLSFTTGTLAATGSGGNVSNSGTPLDNQVAVWTDSTHVEGNSNLSFDSSTNILSSVIMSPTTGFRINGAAANRRILVGNATNFVQSTETYAVPGTSGNVMQSDGTNWTSAQQSFSGLSGNWTLAQGPSITASKLLGRTDASAGVPQEITLGTNLAMSGTTLNATSGGVTAPLTLTASDALTSAVTDTLTLGHNSTGAATTSFGTGLMLVAEDSTTNDVNIGEIQGIWTNPAHSSNSSDLLFRVTDTSATLVTRATLKSTGIFNAFLGFTVAGAAGSGRILQGDGTKYTVSGLVWPTAVGTTGKVLQADGTNYTASTPTWPTAAGTAGYTIRSDATNFASYPAQLVNSSIASQSPAAADVYLTGSNIVVAAGDWKAKGQYKCVFDMSKTAGTGAIVISLRVGTGGSLSDSAIQTYTFGAGTSVADLGMFEVVATWRSVGSGTSAVMQGMCRATHQLTTTGLISNAAGWMVLGSPSPSAGFNSSTFTNIGVSFNGSTAFAGTTTLVQAQLQQ